VAARPAHLRRRMHRCRAARTRLPILHIVVGRRHIHGNDGQGMCRAISGRSVTRRAERLTKWRIRRQDQVFGVMALRM
jgi:hypothetical protein